MFPGFKCAGAEARTFCGDMITIRKASGENDIRMVRGLFEQYAASLGFDLDFQDFESELNDLPGEYAPPAGRVLVAELPEPHGKLAGCVALRPLSEDVCEMKRLYVVPRFRGATVGQGLARAVIREARQIGYRAMRLDTVASMKKANALYASLGFQRISPYRHNPLDDAEFFELNLEDYED